VWVVEVGPRVLRGAKDIHARALRRRRRRRRVCWPQLQQHLEVAELRERCHGGDLRAVWLKHELQAAQRRQRRRQRLAC
jgi:hypothetical protein